MSLRASLSALQHDEATTDIELLIGSEVTTVRAHRLILMARSPVFRSLFLSGAAEHKTGKIQVTSAGPDAVRAFLRFLYTDEIDISAPLEELVVLAEHYEVRLLHAKLEDRLITDVSLATLAQLTELCCAHALPRLEAALAPLAASDPLLHDRVDVQELCRKNPPALLKLLKFMRAGRFAGLLGTWSYVSGEYVITDTANGLSYHEDVFSGPSWSGRLVEDGESYSCHLMRTDGEAHGFLSMRQPAPGKISTKFRLSRDDPWSEDVCAIRAAAPW